jgi:hypothetical protein
LVDRYGISVTNDHGYVTLVVDTSWSFQWGNQNPHSEEEQTTQWPSEKMQKDKQRSTKHTHKTKERVTQAPLSTGVNPGAWNHLEGKFISALYNMVLQRKPLSWHYNDNCFYPKYNNFDIALEHS